MLMVGHVAEQHGQHYLSLDGSVEDVRRTIHVPSPTHRSEDDSIGIEDQTPHEQNVSMPSEHVIDEARRSCHEFVPHEEPNSFGPMTDLERPNSSGLSSDEHDTRDNVVQSYISHASETEDLSQCPRGESEPKEPTTLDIDGREFSLEDMPVEILERILQFSCADDASNINIFNRLSSKFKSLVSRFLPVIHLNDYVAEGCGLLKSVNYNVSIRRLLKVAGFGSGVALRIRQLFSSRSRWINGWLRITALPFNKFVITDIYWK